MRQWRVVLILLVMVASLACFGLPGRGAGPTSGKPLGGSFPADGASRPQPPPSGRDASGESTSAPTSGGATTEASSSAAESGAGELSETAYREAVRPLMRRMRDLGQDSMGVVERAPGRGSATEARERATSLRQQVDDLEGELGAVRPPASYQRAHDNLVRSLSSQKEFLSLQIEAYDNWSDRSAAARSLDRAASRVSDAMGSYMDAAQALNLNP